MPRIKGDFFDSGFLLSAVAAWMSAAAVLLVVSAVLLSMYGCGEAGIGYACSAVSFIAAVAGGIAAAVKRRSAALYTAVITAAVLVTALLTLGFIIAGEEIDASCVMSVVSFTFAGCMVGTVICYPRFRKKKRYTPRP